RPTQYRDPYRWGAVASPAGRRPATESPVLPVVKQQATGTILTKMTAEPTFDDPAAAKSRNAVAHPQATQHLTGSAPGHRGEGRVPLNKGGGPMANNAAGGHKITRRQVLKGAVATATAAAGSRITGFPTVWAQNIKDIKLVQAGGSYSAIIDIGRQ